MGLELHADCADLSILQYKTNDVEKVTIQAVKRTLEGMRSIVFAATNGIEECGLLFQYTDEGLCSYTPYGNGKIFTDYKETYTFNEAFYNYGFYFAEGPDGNAYCMINMNRIIDVGIHDDSVRIVAHIPSRVKRGAAIEDLNFHGQTYTLLLTIAKLCSIYAYNDLQCKALSSICDKVTLVTPRLNERQLEYLKEEYPVAYDAYVSGIDIDAVMPMLLCALSHA